MATSEIITQLSNLELLPTELRTQIYTYLGFPTSRTFNIHCSHAYPTDYKNFGSSETLCPGWSSGPIQLTGIRLLDTSCQTTDPILVNTTTREKIVRPNICGRKGCGLRPLRKDRWLRVATGLMRANWRLYNELSHILYVGLDIEIGFELSEYAVHTRHKRQHAFEGNVEGSNLTRMALSTLLMQRLTNISLSDQVGVGNTAASVRWTGAFCSRVLQRQIRSLKYIAKHCESLQILSISMHPLILGHVRQGQLEGISAMLVEIAAGCRVLQSVELKVYQHKPRCGCYKNPFADQTQHEPAMEPLIRERLDLRIVERPNAEILAVWASSVLADMRTDTRLVMVCPYATTWVPEEGRRIMSSTGATHSIPRG